jgi:hypothetical protein
VIFQVAIDLGVRYVLDVNVCLPCPHEAPEVCHRSFPPFQNNLTGGVLALFSPLGSLLCLLVEHSDALRPFHRLHPTFNRP